MARLPKKFMDANLPTAGDVFMFGIRVTDLTRDELLASLHHAMKEMTRVRADDRRTMNLMRDIARQRRTAY